MFALVARAVLGVVLVAAATLKLAAPESSQAALAGFGLQTLRLRRVAWAALVFIEVLLGVGVALGSEPAAYFAAAMLAGGAVTLGIAIKRGHAGAPCACFGSWSRISGRAIVRNAVLAFAFLAVASLPKTQPTAEQWLATGLVIALVAIAGLLIAVLALAREVKMHRLQMSPRAALEIEDEGPGLGSRVNVIAPPSARTDAKFGLAVFTSAGCRMCQELEPSLAAFEADPFVAVQVFEEERDADVWRDLAIPGSPFALAADRAGTVLAKGTFNTPIQLESILATAEQRSENGF